MLKREGLFQEGEKKVFSERFKPQFKMNKIKRIEELNNENKENCPKVQDSKKEENHVDPFNIEERFKFIKVSIPTTDGKSK